MRAICTYCLRLRIVVAVRFSFSPFLRQLLNRRLVLLHALSSDALRAVLYVKKIYAGNFHFSPDGFAAQSCVSSQLQKLRANGLRIRDFARAFAARAVDFVGLFHAMRF